MTRPNPNPAAPTALPQPHPLPAGVVGVADSLPKFLGYVQVDEHNGRTETIWPCAACGGLDRIDARTRLCPACWRAAVLGPAALNLGAPAPGSTIG